ncbi:MAG: hypothetical protein ACR65T_10535 [Methylocystis sp.]|uniref:hypothetical protein n=1 Tax=Methylocystis sp. TaxID=1911079 RepID=UPI003DA2AAA6
MQLAVLPPVDLRGRRAGRLRKLQPRESESKKNDERDAKWRSFNLRSFAIAGK